MIDESEYIDPFSLDAVVSTATQEPPAMIIYGPDGIGKTSLVSHFPKPIGMFTEKGWGRLSVARFPQLATCFDDLVRGIGALVRDPRGHETFFLDTADWAEQFIWAEVCARNGRPSIESFDFGKGYVLADEVWAELLSGLDALRERGVMTVLLAHAEVTRYTDPNSDPYDRFDLKLHKRARAKLREWADVVGFCYEKTFVKTLESGTGKNKKVVQSRGMAVENGRVLALTRKPAFEAKNRYGLPDEIPLSPDSSTAEELLGRIAHSFTAPTGTEEE